MEEAPTAVNGTKIRLSTDALLCYRRDCEKIMRDLITQQTSSLNEQEEFMMEANAYLDDLFSFGRGNIQLTDNPEFNFAEPVTNEEPFDPNIQWTYQHKRDQLKKLTEELNKTRQTNSQLYPQLIEGIMSNQLKPIVDAEIKKELLTSSSNELNKESVLQNVTIYKEASKTLAQLEEETAKRVSQLDTCKSLDV